MKARGPLLVAIGGAVSALAVLVVRHRRFEMGREVPGGTLIGDARIYDALTHRLLLGSLFRRVADDIAGTSENASRILEVGCGPGHLSILLARRPGSDVTGVDLDPAMIERARVNSERSIGPDARRPTFMVGDVASLPFPDGSFDVVVSTLSMHHWADPAAGVAEIGRVLRPGGRALIWDLRKGRLLLHGRSRDPIQIATGAQLEVASVKPWRWPWKLALLERIDLAAGDRSDVA